jgi:hypothetical protein
MMRESGLNFWQGQKCFLHRVLTVLYALDIGDSLGCQGVKLTIHLHLMGKKIEATPIVSNTTSWHGD